MIEDTVVLDTNVLLSLLITPRGTAAQAVRAAFLHYVIVQSAQTFDELSRKLNSPRLPQRIGRHERGELLLDLRDACAFVEPAAKVRRSRDPDDDAFLALAQASKARFIVTRDKDLLTLRIHGECRIVTPAEFLAMRHPE